jgi:molecular chaperone DnaJ
MAAQREWFEKDYYKVLEVEEGASAKDITKSYRRLARRLHPDANPDDNTSEDRFKEVSAAYDVLGDDAKRKEYDEVRRLGPVGGFGPGGTGGPGGFSFNAGDAGVGDLFGNLFGGSRRRGGPPRSSSGVGPQRGADLEAALTLSFDDAVRGLTTTLYLTSDARCETCDGSGARPGTAPKVCATCGGRGVVDDNQGFFSFSTPCRACQGQGVVIEHRCGTCRGSGVEKRQREVKVRIPAGVSDKQRIRLKGRGAPGRNGGPPGDLLVECHVAPHHLFGRDGDNLTIRVPVTFAEAALGSEIDVPTLDGTRMKVKLKAGTQPGARQRVRGKGIETSKGSGDLIVTVDLVVPTNLTEAEKTAIEQLAAAQTVSPRDRLEG